jgi:hypothetical protein
LLQPSDSLPAIFQHSFGSLSILFQPYSRPLPALFQPYYITKLGPSSSLLPTPFQAFSGPLPALLSALFHPFFSPLQTLFKPSFDPFLALCRSFISPLPTLFKPSCDPFPALFQLFTSPLRTSFQSCSNALPASPTSLYGCPHSALIHAAPFQSSPCPVLPSYLPLLALHDILFQPSKTPQASFSRLSIPFHPYSYRLPAIFRLLTFINFFYALYLTFVPSPSRLIPPPKDVLETETCLSDL